MTKTILPTTPEEKEQRKLWREEKRLKQREINLSRAKDMHSYRLQNAKVEKLKQEN